MLNLKGTWNINEPEQANFRGMIAKYGILDIAYQMPPAHLPNIMRGSSAMKALYLQPSVVTHDEYREAEDIKFDLEWASAKFEMLNEQIRKGKWYLLLFLRTDYPDAMGMERAKYFFQYMKAFPEDYFPRKFVIEDAAISNTKSAWSNKHFYL
ncbi:MAG: hypothetical protein AAFV98_01510 [Chloroflexota bacterium]